jgi:hypothetical protein
VKFKGEKIMNKVIVALITIVVFLLPLDTRAEKIFTEQEAEQKFEEILSKIKDGRQKEKQRKMFVDAKARHREIQFFGKVVDQFGESVADANVFFQVSTMYTEDGVANILVKTNANGIFVLNDIIGVSIYLKEIQRTGYEFTYQSNPNRSYSYKPLARNYYDPDPNNPIIFYMRKKLMPPEYLLADCSNCGVDKRFDPNEIKSFEFYLFDNGWLTDEFESGPIPGDEIVNGTSHRRGLKDFRIEGSPTDDGFYQFCFTPLHENSGVIASDDILYEAPETGYEPDAVIYVDPCGFHKEKKYVYMKTEGGKFYSRLEIELSVYPDRIYIEIRRITNPNSSRNLEYYDEYNARVETRRRKEYRRIKDEKRQKRQEELKKKQESKKQHSQ